MDKCAICGTPQDDDLFSAVTGGPICSTCTIKFVGGLPATDDRIKAIRQRLGLSEGEYLKYDRGEAAKRILGR